MRVTRMGRGDRGSVLIIVSVFAVVALVFAAFVVDIGNQRQNRRQLTTATDAVALGVAKEWAAASLAPGYTCARSTSDDRLAVSNNPVGNTTPSYGCEFSRTGFRQGAVTVRADEIADYAFDGITGIDSGRTRSLSRVAISVVPGGGLRPLALCATDPQIATWVAAFNAGRTPPLDTIVFTKDLTNCGSAPGNWGLLQFAEVASGEKAWEESVVEGSNTVHTIGDYVSVQPGIALNAAEDAFDDLRGETPIFNLPLYSNNPGLPPGGAGNLAQYRIDGFLEVRLIDFAFDGVTAILTIQPLRYDPTGPCCQVNEFNVDLALCDVGTIGGAIGGDPTDCLPPLPPNPTTTTTAPPPVPCQVTGVSILPLLPIRVGPNLNPPVGLGVTVRVSSVNGCDDVTIGVRRQSDGVLNPLDQCCLIDANLRTITGTERHNSFTWTADRYVVEVSEGGRVINSSVSFVLL